MATKKEYAPQSMTIISYYEDKLVEVNRAIDIVGQLDAADSKKKYLDTIEGLERIRDDLQSIIYKESYNVLSAVRADGLI